MEILRSIIESLQDDWLSDYEIQSDYRDHYSLSGADAYARMAPDLVAWIRDGILVPGDLQDGLQVWTGSPEELSERFGREAARLQAVAVPGQICWFDLGPKAPTVDS